MFRYLLRHKQGELYNNINDHMIKIFLKMAQ